MLVLYATIHKNSRSLRKSFVRLQKVPGRPGNFGAFI